MYVAEKGIIKYCDRHGKASGDHNIYNIIISSARTIILRNVLARAIIIVMRNKKV